MAFLIRPISSANLNAMKAMGRSDLFLIIDIVKIIIGIVLLLITVSFGPLAIAYGYLASVVLGMFVNVYPNKKLLNYGYIEQIKDLLNPIIPIAFMAAAVVAAGYLPLSPFPMLCVQIPVGMLAYVLASWVSRNESFKYSLSLVKSLFKKKKKK